MGLFPKEDVLPAEEAAQRRAVTRETGTRRLVLGFIALVALSLIAGSFWQMFLLSKKWPPLLPDVEGVSVVGTLNKKGDYDRNMFRIVQIEGETRPEITNFGWETIFNGTNGDLFTSRTGNIIRSAIEQDSQTGYAMLAPFIRAGVLHELKAPNPYAGVTGRYPIKTDLPAAPTKNAKAQRKLRETTLQELLDYYSKEAHSGSEADTGDAEGGSASGHEVEHGLPIPADVLLQTCPVVMTTVNFSGGWVEEKPAVIGKTTYSVWLKLTPEGRARYYQWTHAHENESLLFILAGHVAAAAYANKMDVDLLEVKNVRDGQAAHDFVDYINKRSAAH